jgi:hypothetical protein
MSKSDYIRVAISLVVMALILTMVCLTCAQAQDKPQFVTVSKDSVLARVKVLDKLIADRESYLKQVPDVEKSLAELRAYRAGLMQVVSDSTLTIQKKK